MIEFDEEDNEVKCKTILNHKDEIWDLKPCPFDKSVLATCSGVARAWRISGEDEEEEQKEEGKNTSGPELEEIVTFKSDKETKRILWEPIEEKRKDAVCIAFHEDGFQMWSLEYVVLLERENFIIFITFSCFYQNLNLYLSFISQENRSSSNTQMHTQIHTQILRTLNSRFALEHRYNINRRHSLNQIKADMLVVLRDMPAFRNVRSEFFQYWKTILK